MIKYYRIKDSDIDIDSSIERHSADEIISYKEVGGEPIYLGYFLPEKYSRDSEYPLFVFVHGGGWESHKIFADQSCWQGDYLGYLARYYADKGFICVSIDYRLARDAGQAENYGIIDCYEDCCDALDFVIEHADTYGIDTEQIHLLGESAGGHLAGGMAAFHYDRRYDFRKVFLINPITYLYDEWRSRVPLKSNHPRLYSLSAEQRAKFLSPLCQLQDDVCEMVLIHGKDDITVNPAHSLKLYGRMKEMKRKCELHLIEETKHAFMLAEYYKYGTGACKLGIQIINEALNME